MKIQAAIARVISGADLDEGQMHSVMTSIMTGQSTPAQIGGFLCALRMKGESVAEITAAARVMRELVTPVEISAQPLVDTCGTGGDGANLFNISTAAAFVVAACGGHVAKHGNRSVSSSTGSADLLEAAGVRLDLCPEQTSRAVEDVGVGFMFAPAHHSAMKHAIGPRKELGMRTIFNVLGPLTNPAGATRQVMGVYDPQLCRPIAEVLKALGSEHVLVVHAEDGLDEFSIAAPTRVAELRDGAVNEYTVDPATLDRRHSDLEGLSVSSAEESLALIRQVFSGDKGASKAHDILALNAGAAVYVAGLAGSLADGVSMADDAISTGLAGEKLKSLVDFSSLCESTGGV